MRLHACHNDHIFRSPTNNDVVCKIIVYISKDYQRNKSGISFVTYDSAVASKAYAIQTLEEPRFDKLLILTGNFHEELAVFGAVGTFLNGSGIETLLAESGILAVGSLNWFYEK